MNDKEKEIRIKKALDYHKKGYNCAQSVACSFCDMVNTPEEISLSTGAAISKMSICFTVVVSIRR